MSAPGLHATAMKAIQEGRGVAKTLVVGVGRAGVAGFGKCHVVMPGVVVLA